MHGRPKAISVPTEILRSVAAIAETGSISKAAKMLGISQPAISAQIKRIEELVGGSIFTKTANGSLATELGKLVLIQARKILEANQQIVLLRGTRNDLRGLKLGLSDVYAGAALDALDAIKLDDVSIVANSSMDIMTGLSRGYLDLGLFAVMPNTAIDPSIDVLCETPLPMVWTRSRDFVLSPGAPIPLVTWGGQISHQLMINALERKGMIYRIAFSSPSLQMRNTAAERGLGLTALPRDEIAAPLTEAREHYLPPLPEAKLYLCRRRGNEITHRALLSLLQDRFFPRENLEAHKLVG